jgi:DNA-directed RNA polymerase specialized sigma24 family protein
MSVQPMSLSATPQEQCTKQDFEAALLFKVDHLLRFALSRGGNRFDAEDLVQDTCVKTFRKYECLSRRPICVHGWLRF